MSRDNSLLVLCAESEHGKRKEGCKPGREGGRERGPSQLIIPRIAIGLTYHPMGHVSSYPPTVSGLTRGKDMKRRPTKRGA